MVFYDGNSKDGTLQILKGYASRNPKVKVFEGKDPENLEEDYVKMFNNCMRELSTDLAIFLHPDMLPANPQVIKNIPNDIIAGSCIMRSFAGEPFGDLFEIKGRGVIWKNIYRLKNPDLGAHYHGFYGAQNEDTYFSEITGNEHKHYGSDIGKYAYPVHNTGLEIYHYSDVRTYPRRLNRMIKCLSHQGMTKEDAEKKAPFHPRVSLRDGDGFQFVKCETQGFLDMGGLE
jgi:hypothetical protein